MSKVNDAKAIETKYMPITASFKIDPIAPKIISTVKRVSNANPLSTIIFFLPNRSLKNPVTIKLKISTPLIDAKIPLFERFEESHSRLYEEIKFDKD